MKAILYPAPIDDSGKKLAQQNKITIIDRVNTVNIENPTFHPRFDLFLEGYVHNRGRPYFVMQGHPSHWDELGFSEFVKMLDFLVEQKAVFAKAFECAASQHTGP